jgi:hypothetical protein
MITVPKASPGKKGDLSQKFPTHRRADGVPLKVECLLSNLEALSKRSDWVLCPQEWMSSCMG